MAYATVEYYRDTYQGNIPATEAEVQKYLDRSTDDIDYYTRNEIDVSTLSTFQNGLLMKACCAQAEHYVMNGETYNDAGDGSVTIGKFSTSGSQAAQNKTMSKRSIQYLDQAGLLFAGVNVAGGYYLG